MTRFEPRLFSTAVVAVIAVAAGCTSGQPAGEAEGRPAAAQGREDARKAAQEQRDQELVERFRKDKDRLFGELEAVDKMIGRNEPVAATVALAKLGKTVSAYGQSKAAELFEYETLVKALNKRKRSLEDLVAKVEPEFDRRVKEAVALGNKREFGEADAILTEIEQDFAPLDTVDELRVPVALRGMRDRYRERVTNLRSQMAEMRSRRRPGDRIVLGDFAYVVEKAESKGSVGNWLTRKTAGDGATFLIVRYTIENLGDETETVLADDFQVEDTEGRSYSPSAEANTTLAMSGGSKDLFASELHPGVKRKMITAFEVPKKILKEGFTIIIPEKGLLGTGREKVGPLVMGPGGRVRPVPKSEGARASKGDGADDELQVVLPF